jgi:amino acid transporter
VDVPRAAAILYGDWGTSKAHVIGLAFAVAGYSSFWLIAAMCVLTALVGVNYITICKHYPDGGGVYASVRHRSEVISIVGAFLLVADYIVTASIQRAVGVSVPGRAESRTVCGGGNSDDWCAELFRAATHRGVGVSDCGANRDYRASAGFVYSPAPGGSDSEFAPPAG